MAMYDYIWLCITMFDYVWLCRTVYDYEWPCMTIYDCIWLCMTMFDYVWVSMTEYKREKEINFQNFFILFPSFWNYKKISNNLNFFHDSNVFKLFILFNKPWLCLPLCTFVYLCLPLFTFVYLCSNDASMHKLCACFKLSLFSKSSSI